MIEPPMCYNCRQKYAAGLFCRAFPRGIPDAILTNKADHREPYPGDGGIRYDAIDPSIDVPEISGETTEGVSI